MLFHTFVGGDNLVNKTPLNKIHKKLGAKMVEFSGWEMPLQYQSIIQEHMAVRKKAGVFDVSHMGQIMISGVNAGEQIQKIVTNDISEMDTGHVIYTPMCNNNGGIIDDFLIYCLKKDKKYMLVVNAANIEKDFNWIKEKINGKVDVQNVSRCFGQLALQGPDAEQILQPLIKNHNLKDIKYYRFEENVDISGVKCLVSRTGYTGEDGFEIYAPWDKTIPVWEQLLQNGKKIGLQPCGLGARDILRFEVCYPLYGHELREDLTPLAAGLEWTVKFSKGDFTGRSALKKEKQDGPKLRLIGFVMMERGIPRKGYKILKENQKIGFVTSGSFSPILNKNLGLGYIKTELANLGEEIHIHIRGKNIRAKITEKPFYRKGDSGVS